MSDTTEKTPRLDRDDRSPDVIPPAPDTGALVLDSDQTWWSERQLAALRQIGVDTASQGDLLVFHHVCQRTGLDPFAKQIYMIGRQGRELVDGEWQNVIKQTIQTGIDGFRLIADRGDHRDGTTREYEDTLWCGTDGVWTDVWVSKMPPMAAKVTVLRDGRRFPAVAVYAEYVQTKRNGDPNSMWDRMPSNQLAKCAEALALRKAYPQDLSGLYTDDEMAQADNDEAVEQRAVARGSVREAMQRRQQSKADEETTAAPKAGRFPGKVEEPNMTPGTPPVEDTLDGDVMLDPRGGLAQSLHKAFREADVDDKAKRYEFITRVIGRTVTALSELTEPEAHEVLAAIAQHAAGENVPVAPPVDPAEEHARIIAEELAQEEKNSHG